MGYGTGCDYVILFYGSHCFVLPRWVAPFLFRSAHCIGSSGIILMSEELALAVFAVVSADDTIAVTPTIAHRVQG
jgi:hypothetical protein